MKIWGLRAELNRDLPRMRRQFFQLKYRGMHQRRIWRFFHFLGLIPRAPNFAEFHARGGGGRLPVMPRDRIAPWGRTPLHGEAEKPTTAVGLPSPKGVPWRGRRGDLRAADGGNWRAGGARRGGFGGGRGNLRAFGRRTAGGSGRGRMQKPHTQAASQRYVAPSGAGVPGKNGSRTAFFRAQPGKTRPHQAEKRRLGGLQGWTWRALGAKKPLFAAKVLAEALCWGENWRKELAGREGLSGPLQGIFGWTGRKRWGLYKAISRAYRKKNVPAPFLCR